MSTTPTSRAGLTASLCMLAASVVFAFHAGGGGSSPEGGGIADMRPLAEHAPDRLVIQIEGLEGFFADCGCSGLPAAGIARLPLLLPEVTRRTSLFTGWMLIPEVMAGDSSARNLIRADLENDVAVADRVTKGLGHAVWLAEQAEVRELGLLGADFASLRERIGSADGQFVAGKGLSIGRDRIRLGDAETVLGRPETRGRSVRVFAIWSRKSGPLEPNTREPAWVFDKDLLGAYMAARESTTAREKVVATLRQSRDQSLVSFADVPLDGMIPVDDRLVHEVSRQRPDYNEGDAHAHLQFQQSVHISKAHCLACHGTSVNSFAKGPHHSAVRVLTKSASASQGRCLACHAPQASLYTGIGGLTCESCHEGTASPYNSCLGCHTEASDPKGSFRQALASVCGGGRDAPEGRCVRAEFGTLWRAGVRTSRQK